MKKIFCTFLSLIFINQFAAAAFCASPVNVPAGTRVPIIVSYIKTSKNTISGEKVNAQVERDIKVGGVVVFKEGARAVLNVADSKKSGFMGSPGIVHLVNGTVLDANQDIHRTEFYHKITGDEKTWPKVVCCLGFFLLPLLLFGFVKGGDAKIIQHTPITVEISDGFTFIAK